ncbi:MAG: hypothetical protein R3F59_14430 [Myxococcota bacterium]
MFDEFLRPLGPLTLLALAAPAAATPYQALVPASTLAAQDSEMGGAVTVGSQDLGGLASGAGPLHLGEDPAQVGAIAWPGRSAYGLSSVPRPCGAWILLDPPELRRLPRVTGAQPRHGRCPVRPRLALGASVGTLMLAPVDTSR